MANLISQENPLTLNSSRTMLLIQVKLKSAGTPPTRSPTQKWLPGGYAVDSQYSVFLQLFWFCRWIEYLLELNWKIMDKKEQAVAEKQDLLLPKL